MRTASNDTQLSYRGINDEYIFFYQRWQELLDYRTLDMYQYNILNVYVACSELLEVIDKTITGLLTSRQNVDDVKAEALKIIKNDDILIKYNKPLRITLLRITSEKIESKSKNEITEDRGSSFYVSLNRLKYKLHSPLTILKKEFIYYILEELKVDIAEQNKEKIERHMSILISQCISNRWSAKGLFELSQILEGSQSSESKWINFTNRIINSPLKNFNVFYSIKIETRPGLTVSDVQTTIHSLGLNLSKGSQIIEKNNHIKELCSAIDSAKYYSIISIEATDVYAAALMAINELNNLLSIATFYNIINSNVANFPTIIVFDVTTIRVESMQITDVFKTYDYLDSSNNVFEDTKNIIANSKKHDIAIKLYPTFSYTNLSRTSPFQETKYISLWIALESIMRTGQYSDIFSHVKKVLPAALCIRYIYRIIRNFAEDCIRCRIKRIGEPLNVNMESSNKKDLVTKLVSIFRDENLYFQLQQHCQISQLLHYRCCEIHVLLNDYMNIFKKLESHKEKIEWHVQRLYRIRNEITHSAYQNSKSLIIYIEHLYTYLAQLISEIVFYIEHKDASSVEEVYATIVDCYQTFIELLKENTFEVRDILPNGVIELSTLK